MNVELANSTAMSEILTKLGIIQRSDTNLTIEKIICSVCEYLKDNNENHTAKDAVRWLKNMTGNTHSILNVDIPANYEYNSEEKLTRKKPRDINKKSLIRYIENRGIALNLAKCFLQEVTTQNKYSQEITTCLGLKNENGGYELRKANYKASTNRKGITFIRGKIPKPDNIHVFRTIIDFLSVLTILKVPSLKGDAIILNSMEQLSKATPYIKHYGYLKLFSYMSNDDVGRRAVNSISNFTNMEQGLIHKPMNNVYNPHKDINAWHMFNLNLV